MRTICLFFAFAALLAAADVTGAWTGTVVVTDPSSGEKISTNVKAQLAQKSGAVTGKIGREHDDELETIRDGKVSGNVVVFAVQPAEATTPMQFTLTLVTPDRIEGDMKGAIDTGNISGKVVLTRAKP
jgi:hypothetical protein